MLCMRNQSVSHPSCSTHSAKHFTSRMSASQLGDLFYGVLRLYFTGYEPYRVLKSLLFSFNSVDLQGNNGINKHYFVSGLVLTRFRNSDIFYFSPSKAL
jgi:hypothetical protein